MKLLIFLVLMTVPAVANAIPPLHETVAAARRAQELDGPLDAWSTRSRWRALMPRVGGYVGGDRTNELDLTFRESAGVLEDGVLLVEGTQNTTEDDWSDKIGWRVSLTWDFRDIVFSTSELAAAREQRARQAARVRLDLLVTKLHRTCRDDAATVACDELDVLTAGWFRRRLGGPQ